MCFHKVVFFPVPNAWGKEGFTSVKQKETRKDMFKDELRVAYNFVAKRNDFAKGNVVRLRYPILLSE